jgi:hypothetical protein
MRTLAEMAERLGIEPALARRLAEDGSFPLPVVGSGASSRVPAGQAAVLLRALRPAQRPVSSSEEVRWPGPW